MGKKKTLKSRPVAFRLPVEKYSLVAAAARRSGLSIGAFAAQMALEGAEGREDDVAEGQVFTDWRDAQLPPGDRADTPEADIRESKNTAFSTLGRTEAGHTGVSLSNDENGTPNEARRADGRTPHDQDDGTGQGEAEGAGRGEGNVDRGVPGLDVTAVSDQERPGGSDDDLECPLRGPFSSDPATNGDPLISDAASGDGFDFTPAANADGSPLTGQDDLSDLGDGGTQPRSSEGAGEAVPEVREDEHQREMDGGVQHDRTRADRVAALDADRRRERFNALRER